MSEDKFTSNYFEMHYHIADYKPYNKIYKNVVFRNEDSLSECQVLKEQCLRACFTHFLGADLTGTKNIKQHFTQDNKLIRLLITRCCCSQFEETHITHAVVTHKSTNISFIVGKDCFNKLFAGADDIDTFWKEECKYCKNIVAKRMDWRPNFCNQKCVNKYKEDELKKNSVKSKTKKIYLKCEECDKPKKTDSQQKWPLCYDCHNKSSDED
jgi:hypothetical protein